MEFLGEELATQLSSDNEVAGCLRAMLSLKRWKRLREGSPGGNAAFGGRRGRLRRREDSKCVSRKIDLETREQRTVASCPVRRVGIDRDRPAARRRCR